MRDYDARLASAPVSFGIFGGADTSALAVRPDELLLAIGAAGYAGSELGPPGFFGSIDETRDAFAAAGLRVAGAYGPLHLSLDDRTYENDLDLVRSTLAELAELGEQRAPLVLADEGDEELIRRPFRRSGERRLDAAQWEVAVRRIGEVAALARSYEVPVTFHPHFATYVDQADEIDRLLETTDVGLCLDTGHFHLGGADPIEYLRRWRERINHIHLKDLHESVRDSARDRADQDFEQWWEHLCCPLGTGDVDVSGFMRVLDEAPYDGWLVVEQDRGPATAAAWDAIVKEQEHNANWLEFLHNEGR